jgi:DNA mismatch endonuclease (patch repair protein)
MSSVGTKDTGPELAVRRMLHRLGYRYRLHRSNLPAKPDLVFPGRGKVILVHGCFWHGHGCRWGGLPKSKRDYWAPKIAANRARDARQRSQLTRAGWKTLVVWQCQLRDPTKAVARMRAFLDR